MKKVLSLVLALIMMLALVPVVQADELEFEYFNGEWDFKYYQNSSDVPEDVTKIVFEDKIQVPGAMELQGYGYPSYFYEEMGGWGQPEDDGVRSAGVYKTDFYGFGPGAVRGSIRFENVTDEMTVYLNGEKVGYTKTGMYGYEIDVTLQQKNTLICVVKRDNSGINKKDDFSLSGIMGEVIIFSQKKDDNYFSNSKNLEVKNDVLYIDGAKVVLKGVKYTATHPESGNIMANEQIDKDLELIKAYGFNCVWTSCAPIHFYEKASEMGLYIIEEADINLGYVDRDTKTAKERIEKMIETRSFCDAVIMWSVGQGNGNAQQLIELVKTLDSRPVAQEVNFAPDFEVFGNTGGMTDWVETLGDGNVGGFVDEFADKELYYTQNAYLFETKDTVTGETITIDGEVENYKGIQMLGDASYVRDVEQLDKYTIVTEIGAVDGDRVIFESGNVKFEVRGGRARFNVGDKRVRADVQEGKIAAVYADGEIQLFVNNAFAGNEAADAEIEGNYTVGGGDTAIAYVEIYNDALTLDELIEGADKSKLISRVDFDAINIKEDKSYKFLAYGGDFGDNPNSYYKCLTGIFSSTRVAHPEAEAFRVLLTEQVADEISWGQNGEKVNLVTPVIGENEVTFNGKDMKAVVSFDGKITSLNNGRTELLSDVMYPTVVRENTLSEYEMGVENYEGWRKGKAEVIDNVLYIELVSTVTEGRLYLAYSMNENGKMHVSVQSEFADDATKPTFIGFRGVSKHDKVSWIGSKTSTYPDRIESEYSDYDALVSEMGDIYAVPHENGNRNVYEFGLLDGENYLYGLGQEDLGNMLVFSTASDDDTLQMQVLDYSPWAMENADHDEDIEKDGNTYFRVGGYIAGISGKSAYKLNDNVYGYDFYIAPGHYGDEMTDVKEIYMNGKEYNAFTSGVKTYVYQTNEKVEVTADGCEVVQDDKKAVVGDYVVYFAPDTEYLSDMTAVSKTAEIALDTDFNGSAIAIRSNDYWSPAQSFDKGVTLKNGSVTYDVSGMDNHMFNAVIGKNDFDWRRGGNFDRSMFDASCTVTITLDGVVVEEVKDVSMRSGSREVNIDVSNAKEMTITVTGSGRAPQYEDAVFANSAFVPAGPVVVNFENTDGKATITVLNTDKESIDVVLTATENNIITTEATSIGKGLYRTVEVPAGDKAVVKAYVTGIGEISLE